MKNRAKCKLCQSIIESFHSTDYVSCKCGEISVDGGEALKCAANDWKNFVRVDDNGSEIMVKIKEDVNPLDIQELPKPTKRELLNMLEEMAKNIENLPQAAMLSPVNHYDLYSALILISSIFNHED